MVYRKLCLLCVTSKTHLHRKQIRISMPLTRFPRHWSSRIARSRPGQPNSSHGVSGALSRIYFGRGTLLHYCCFICGIARQAAVYGGLSLGLGWNVLLFACTCGCIIKRMVLCRHSFRKGLSLIGGIEALHLSEFFVMSNI